ncbi:putative arginine deiminase [Tieghemostelium lacteum]|uniref:Putative arginine deiminase n=1 Tax=Tieghemostelium lacteum TaxID=361077 RepID=A0A152A4G5_TIELA|nr:putative arginine deiminase [Tieghemostelium lacteum]|eukprot:KYR01130.1 putative arginine deiminase [Tieghemostelium lacteum]
MNYLTQATSKINFSMPTSPKDEFKSNMFTNGHMNSNHVSYKQVHENDKANIVILNEPSLCQWMGSIHPNGSLYEEPLDISKAQKEHAKFRHLLESEGCIVYTVREILTGTKINKMNDITHRVHIEDFAFNSVSYVLDENQSEDELGQTDKMLLSDEYKRQCLDSMSNEQLVDVILTRPTIKLRKSERDTELLATNYSFKPLVNLVFQRDQQITTANGIVMANLSSPIRAPEVEVMKLCFKLLELPVIGEIPNPGRLEGGDFYPCGQDLCFIGVGLRSNFYAVQYLMDNNLLGTSRVAVVKDYFDMNQQRMHLDTVCNIIDHKVMLILEDICGEQSSIRRLVDEYTRNPDTGRYELSRHDIEYSRYLEDQGFQLVKVSNQNQADYGCNGLNIGNGKFIVVDKATAKTVARSSKSKTQLIFVDFRTVTKMYGSVHCCSQVVSRSSPETLLGMVHSESNESFIQHMNNISPPPTIKRNSVNLNTAVIPNPVANYQGKDIVLMVAPTYFVKPRVGSELINASVIRKTRQLVLQDYAKLHRTMVELGVDIHLFAHEPYHGTDHAVYVSEWFSTHSKEELGVQEDTLVLYPLKDVIKRRERRADILKYAFLPRYTRVLDFTPCESGQIQVIETTIQKYLHNQSNTLTCSGTFITSTSNQNAEGSYLDHSGIVLDRKSKLAYISIDEKICCLNVAQLWAKTLGYNLITMKSQHRADKFLNLGKDFAIFCPEALDTKADADVVLEHLKASQRSIILINIHQMNQFIAEVIEINARTQDKSILIITEKYYNLYTAQQIQQLEQCVQKIIRTDLPHLQSQGGNNMIGMIGQLY